MLLALLFTAANSFGQQASYSGFIGSAPVTFVTDIYSDGVGTAVYVYDKYDDPIRLDDGKVVKNKLTFTEKGANKMTRATLTFNNYDAKASELDGVWKDAKTGKTGKLYFMYEIYNGTSSAASSYKAIYEANRIHEGVEVVKDLGSEAYYHTDGTGFYFYLVRKNEKMFRLKLNKITSHSSALQFKTVTKQIADKL